MFGLSMMEVMVILVVALLVLGPNELPKAAKSIGKTLRDVRRASDDLRDTFEREVMQEKPPPQVRRPDGETAAAWTETPPSPPGALPDAIIGANAPPTGSGPPPAVEAPAPPNPPAPPDAPATPPAPALRSTESGVPLPPAPVVPAPPAPTFSLGDDPFATTNDKPGGGRS